ncbi:ABC transporter permease [Candidatus Sumerlaeota bacterium]|nr:ABC transporter permease [Candidatus Sumerlaeota bacterium]
MRTYIIKRLLQAIPLLFAISLVTFFLINRTPGDYLARMRMNPQISEEVIEAEKRRLGLDNPHWYVRYGKWLKNVILHQDFGYSFSTNQPVFTIIKERLFNTFILSASSIMFAWILSIPLGILSAVYQYRWVDKLCSAIAFFGLSIPDVFFALLMVLFAKITGWFPTGGMRSLNYEELSTVQKILDVAHHLVLPTIVLGTASMANYMRQMRGNLLDVLRLDYVTVARAKGLSEPVVILKHATRNAINPLITLFGYSFSVLLSGAFLVEVVFSYPGLGRTTIEALFAKDMYLVVAAVLMSSVMLIIGNLIADLILALSDPRIRLE